MQTVKGKVIGVTVTAMKGKPFEKWGQGAYFHPLSCSGGQTWTLRMEAGLYWSPFLGDANLNPSEQELQNFSVLFGLLLSLWTLCWGSVQVPCVTQAAVQKTGNILSGFFWVFSWENVVLHKMLIGRYPIAWFMVDQHISWPTCCVLGFIWEV